MAAVTQDQIELLQLQLADANAQLRQTREHAAKLAEALDGLRTEHSQSITGIREALMRADAELTAAKTANADGKKSLVDLKPNEPGKFAGKDAEDIKVWSKSVRAWCNVRRRGFRQALEWAELQSEAITAPDALAQIAAAFPSVVETDAELYELLAILCTGDALVLVERSKEHGFDAWRRLHARYNPKGGRFELDTMTKLLTRERCTNVAQIPAAVDKFEREIAAYEIRSNNAFPPEWKTPILLKMLPKKEADELNIKFGLGERDYAKLVTSLVGYSNEIRVAALREKDPHAMEVDSIAKPEDTEWTSTEWVEWTQNIVAAATNQAESLDWIGKGKGKGKKGKGADQNGKGAGKGKGLEQPGRETRTCHWCLKPGHLKVDCRAFKAGKPKAPRGPGTNSLDDDEGENDWEEDLGPRERLRLRPRGLERCGREGVQHAGRRDRRERGRERRR